jgi:hypothetical protein
MLQLDGRGFLARRLTGDEPQNLGDLLRRNQSVAVDDLLEFFEDLGGSGDGLVRPLDVDAIVAARHANAERVANLAQMLVAGAEQREESL